MTIYDIFPLQHLGDEFIGFITLLALSSERLLVIMTILPATADNVLKGTLRNGAAAVWCLFVACGQQALIPQLRGAFLVIVCTKEAVIGLVLGIAASTVFWAAEAIGTYVDDVAGFNNVQMQNPSTGTQTSLMGTLFGQLTIASFWLLGGMMFLLGALYESYAWWPLGSFDPVPAPLLEMFAQARLDMLMNMIARIATPMMVMVLLIDLCLAFVTRSAQKLDLMSISQPLKGAVAVLIVAVLAGSFVTEMRGQISLAGLAQQVRQLGERSSRDTRPGGGAAAASGASGASGASAPSEAPRTPGVFGATSITSVR
ncbi:type III secretion system export apparatus subunit SctT [Burkholderia oklahomensis]|uniref:type III secretion system export apparatus subunit SctT n=1 Tax=Burkholderia oklahomensis TaxID=342113 RepID=UPI00016A9EE5|nr:type III secretion system export apparatus subunit SctT [Burkholderia oklahomensis]AJX34144.1 type III secretion apparatus protein SpaR/YscT/HrcT [Burkholderia oklahomensis C6786]AOI48588.1 type III secretion protein [Burkholderia oklahomensis C6786]KUY47375.1 type III secretion protein [Burkholderia oklahomensis C6786]MBI0363240.1 type III secretion system export apparatus subunit SctT [Burkholderia oklahomensis]SUY27351.1 flagellar biosynthesis protein FliR [Burkholderia oklahomensis]